MTYVSVITLVTYALVLGLLAVVSVIDIRSRRVPNGLAAALGFLWVAWRVVLGFAGAHMGLGFRAEFLGPAPDVLVPPGLEIGGISFASGVSSNPLRYQQSAESGTASQRAWYPG